jgi:hypothetical protein
MLIALLFAPILVCLDTDKELYSIQFKGFFKMYLEANKTEVLRIKLQTLFRNFYFYPLREKEHQKKKIMRIKSKRKWSIPLSTAIRLLKSFKLKRFNLDIDTSNCITNAKLYPLFALLNYKYGGFNINFDGRNKLLLYLENRPIRILTSFINFKT